MAGSVTISGTSSVGSETRTLGTLTITNAAAVDESIVVTLASGDNTYPVPASATGVIIIPGSSLTGTIKYRTNLNIADTGPAISLLNARVLSFPSPAPTSLILNSSVLQTGTVELWFW